MATKKTKKKVNADDNKIYVELKGSVSLVEIKDGVRSRTPLEGDLVLHAIVSFIEQSIKEALERKTTMDTLVKKAKKLKDKKKA